MINKEISDSRLNLNVYEFEKNEGLSVRLNDLIRSIKNQFDYIARMDSDDISVSNRFDNQIRYLIQNPNIDIVGGFVNEFGFNNGLIKYPLKNYSMRQYFAKRNPLAHVATMFRKSFFIKAGYYPTDTLLNEDSILWLNGFKSN